jgi:hypothetical protein
MKNFVISTFATLSLMASTAYAFNCTYKEVEHTNNRYVYPVYRANVSYFFSKSSKDAYALANWEFDVEKTRECFNSGKEQYPQSKLLVPPVSVSKVEFKILGSNGLWELDTYPLQNGHWNASSIMIPIAYNTKMAITEAISKNQSVVEFIGNPRMRITLIEKRPVSKIKCTEKDETLGVLSLFKRLGEVKTFAETIRASSGVKVEEVLQDFLGECVEFTAVDAYGLVEFAQQQKLNSRIKKGEFSVIGFSEIETYLDMPGISNQNTSIQEI